MSSERTMHTNSRGFTLAELLIVVAIIAVLVAIAIPVFTSQLEKSREGTDLANVRSAYAEVMAAAITEDKTATYDGVQIYDETTGVYSATVGLVQKVDDWQGPVTEIGGVSKDDEAHWVGIPEEDGECTISYTTADGASFFWSGYTYTTSMPWTYTGTLEIGVTKLGQSNANPNWAQHVTSVNQLIDVKPGQNVMFSGITSSALTGYTVGIFVVDKDNIILADSKEIELTSGDATYQIPSGITDTGTKIAIQIINKNGAAPSQAEARELLKSMTITG
ncbi:MAG: prepilin-type N-terminal cleavage/methylation domain-containing protein [Coriobacteriia bacterium]|nr:prepilin-type N-terminal cleavage/methylation domain-containing protein [Coriobacteriia bacterium]